MPQKTLNTLVDIYQLHNQAPEDYPFLLESVAENEKIGRFDILFYRPQMAIQLDSLDDADFLSQFNHQWLDKQGDEDLTISADIPFRGGWFVFFSYELAQQIEPTLALTAPPYPIAYAAKCGAAIVVDKVLQKTYLVADLSEVDALPRIEKILAKQSKNQITKTVLRADIIEDDPEIFSQGVDISRQYIIDGDVFQVNLSRGWRVEMDAGQSLALYAQLRENNPAPFAASCNIPGVWVVSSSPERLISIRDGQIETRPIAGTRPRGMTVDEDSDLSAELIGHFKERAEHVMLIDLERNDLGRICQAGTVKVDELMVIESYAHVHHIVSNVVGKIRSEITPADAIRAVFPGGTITGAPKIRCMEIIYELEQTYRGAYTGTLGYVNHNGEMDTNILIRSFACHADKAEFRAGGGIVYDSITKNELQETRNKAKGLLKALE